MEAIKQLLARLRPGQRRAALLGGGALLVAAIALMGADDGGDDRVAARNAPGSPASIFASRSPGARRAGVLLQTKRRRAAAHHLRARPRVPPAARSAAVQPTERVLSVIRRRPPVIPALALADTGPYSLDLGQGGLAPLPGFEIGRGPGFEVPQTEFAVTPGGSSEVDVPPAPAVPEPATWLLLTCGLGLVGHALRRQRRVPLPA